MSDPALNTLKRLRRHLWEQPRSPWVISALSLILLLFTLGITGHWYHEYLLREIRNQVEEDVSIRGIALTAVMNRRFALLDGLAAFVGTDYASPDFSIRLDTYVQELNSNELGIRNIAIAPGGVVKYIYPLEGNEQVLGYQPLLDPRDEVSRDVAEAIDTREIVLTGPIELLQGGKGLIARKAIFINNTYWGLVNIVLDSEMVVSKAGLLSEQTGNLDLALAVVGGDFISGSTEILEQAPTSQTILLPGEQWVLAGIPAEGWEAAIRPNMVLFQGLGLTVVGLLVSLIYLSLNRQVYLAQAVKERTSELASMYAQLQTDLAIRRLTEEALEEQKEQYRSVFETVQDGLFIHDLDGNLVGFNQAAHKMYGYTAEEFARLKPAQYIRADDYHLFEAYLQAIREGREFRCQAAALKKDGAQMDYEILGTPFTYQGAPHALSIVRDITEQAQAYQLLEQRVDERTRDVMTLMQISQNLVSTLELEPLLELILDQLRKILDYTGASISTLQDGLLRPRAYRGPRPKSEVFHATFSLEESVIDREIFLKRAPVIIPDVLGEDPMAQALKEYLENASLPPEQIFRSWLGVPLIYKGRYIGNLTFDHQEPNFYHARHAELAQAFANQAAIAIENARLYGEIGVLASLQERQKLARELHDSVSQALYGIALGMRTIRSHIDELPANQPIKNALEEPLNYTSMLVEAGMAEMRALIFELRPESLALEGLIAALTKQAAAIQARYQLDVITCLGEEPPVDLETKHMLYRIAQEALHNTVKHGQASKVFLCLVQENGDLALSVQDNGIGFNPQESFPGHLGLVSMRERAEKLGGTFSIESTPGLGTKIIVQIPQALALNAPAPSARSWPLVSEPNVL